jgi:hypothetical protein
VENVAGVNKLGLSRLKLIFSRLNILYFTSFNKSKTTINLIQKARLEYEMDQKEAFHEMQKSIKKQARLDKRNWLHSQIDDLVEQKKEWQGKSEKKLRKGHGKFGSPCPRALLGRQTRTDG